MNNNYRNKKPGQIVVFALNGTINNYKFLNKTSYDYQPANFKIS